MKLSVDERWDLIDKISKETVTFGKYKHTLKDAIGELTIKPLTGIPIAIAVLYGFWSVFSSFAGTLCTDGFLCKIFDEHWLPWLQSVFPGGLGNWFYELMVDAGHMENGLLVASDNCFESFGVLTSGLFVPFGVVLPAVFIFYLMMTLLEDVGYLPRLAVLIDTVLHKIGLHGYAIVPTILGLGCNVPAVTATRILETRKQRFMMMTLLAIFIPCGAQLGIMKEVIPDTMGFVILYLLFGYFVFGFILNKIIPGKSPEILIDVPPYQMPTKRNVGRKVWIRVSGFLKVAVPFVMLGCLIVGVMYLTGFMDWLGDVLSPVFVGWFGVPKETAGPLVAAFLRKDLAVGMLSAIEMTKYQMISSVVLVSIYFPCLATFIMILKEGGKELLGSLAALVASVFFFGGLLHLIWITVGVA
jgi:ferrous iron transport protein B